MESKVVQVIDAKALKTIADTFNQEADEWKAKHGVEFPGMLIDHEHFKHDPSKESRAYGWLMRIEARTDGLYGQINWSDTGKKAVDGSDYRFFSTEYPEDGFEIPERTNSNSANRYHVHLFLVMNMIQDIIPDR